MCLGSKAYQRSVFWDEDENLVRFKYPLPSGTKQEDVTVGIDENGNSLTKISMVVSSHTGPFSSASSWMIIPGSSFFSLLKKKEGDTTSPIIPMKFNLPTGLDPNGFETAVDDEGLLTLTFKKLVPIHSEKPFDLKNVSFDWVTAKEKNKEVVHFKAYLAAGTKMENMTVAIRGRNSLMIGIHDLLKKEEGDTGNFVWLNGNNFRCFTLPEDANPNGFKAAMDDQSVLTVTFTKLKREKKKLVSRAKKMLGCLAQAVRPAACVLICEKISDAICSGDY